MFEQVNDQAVQDEPKVLTQADMDKAVEAAVSGLKAKNGELLGKLKEQSGKLAEFDGVDPNAVKNILQRFSDDEEAKLIASGKIDEVLSKRTERMSEAHDKALKKLQDEAAAHKARADKFVARVLDDAIRQVAATSGVHAAAVDDALYRARELFHVDDEGNAAARENVFGPDGKPLTLKEWFEDMKEKAPHWFPAPSGGGNQYGGKVQAGLKRSEMSPEDKRAFVQQHGQAAFLKLPQ